jgi:hypothetical protein
MLVSMMSTVYPGSMSDGFFPMSTSHKPQGQQQQEGGNRDAESVGSDWI